MNLEERNLCSLDSVMKPLSVSQGYLSPFMLTVALRLNQQRQRRLAPPQLRVRTTSRPHERPVQRDEEN
jgi:hypothetical protein